MAEISVAASAAYFEGIVERRAARSDSIVAKLSHC